MQHLTPVGLSEDGTTLVLLSDAGEEFRLVIDKRLRAALRGDHARLGQLEMKMESALRPRDIQARIRAGESAEDVAAAAQTTVEAIMPFAGPVIAERAHVAQTALAASIRRRSAEASPAARTLDEAARRFLSASGARADDVAWDAWRRDDGRWTLTAAFTLAGTEHEARFTYDQPGRYVIAEDEQARLLTGEAAPATASDPAPRRRLAAVAQEDVLPLGDDALELVRDPEPPATADPDAATSDLTDAASAVRAAGRHAAEDGGTFEDMVADHADADWIAEPADRTSEPEPSPEPGPESRPASASESVSPEPAPEPAPAEPKSRKKGRSSVPSWDEIMFGGSRD